MSARQADARQTIRDLVHLARLGWVSREKEAAEAEEKYQAIRAEIAAEVRTEVLAEVKTEVVAWLVKKAAEQQMWDAGVLASKVDRGAVRAFIGTGHYRDAMDAFRTEVLGEAYDTITARAVELSAMAEEELRRDLEESAQEWHSAALVVAKLITGSAGKDTRDGAQPPAGESTQPADAAALLALATVLEIPRPNTGIPFQLRLSHGHADRWAICDRMGRRWYRDLGWMYEPSDDRLCGDGRFTLAEAVPLAREIAATEGEVPRG